MTTNFVNNLIASCSLLLLLLAISAFAKPVARTGSDAENERHATFSRRSLTETRELDLHKRATERNTQCRDTGFLWTEGEIPYEFDGFDQKMKRRAKRAIGEWEQCTCIKFIKKKPRHKEFITFKANNKDESSSCIGRQPTNNKLPLGQVVNIAKGAEYLIYLHEIGHAIGLHHEHARADRDEHIRVIWDHIKDGEWGNFEIEPRDSNPHFNITPYDYQSVMHYGLKAFINESVKHLRTIEVIDQAVDVKLMGKGKLSLLDIQKVNLLYAAQCEPKCSSPPTKVKNFKQFRVHLVHLDSNGYKSYLSCNSERCEVLTQMKAEVIVMNKLNASSKDVLRYGDRVLLSDTRSKAKEGEFITCNDKHCHTSSHCSAIASEDHISVDESDTCQKLVVTLLDVNGSTANYAEIKPQDRVILYYGQQDHIERWMGCYSATNENLDLKECSITKTNCSNETRINRGRKKVKCSAHYDSFVVEFAPSS